jgi:hypothetical protein
MGLAAGVLVGGVVRRIGGLWLIAAGVVMSALAPIALAAARDFWSALFAFSVLTLAIWVSVTTLIGERQRHAPHHLQARVGITGRGIAFASMMVGSLIASLLATFIPLRALYLGVGLAALAVAAWAVPALVRTAAAGRPTPAPTSSGGLDP